MNAVLIEKYLVEIFQKNGFKQVCLDEIAKELHISKKTIYKEYKDKHNLIEQTVMNLLNSTYGNVITIVAEESPFVEKFYSIFRVVKENLMVFDDVSLSEIKKSYPDIWLRAARFRKYNIIPLLKMLLTSGIKKGVLYDYPVELYLRLIYGAIKETTRRDKEVIENELNLMLRILLNGALTKKGKKFLNYKLVNVN